MRWRGDFHSKCLLDVRLSRGEAEAPVTSLRSHYGCLSRLRLDLKPEQRPRIRACASIPASAHATCRGQQSWKPLCVP
jgi:hypothetical protein